MAGVASQKAHPGSVTSLPGLQGPWAAPARSGAACPGRVTMARTGSGSRGHRNTVTTRFKSRRPGDVPYTRWQLRVVGLGRRDGPLGTATLYHLRSITQWVLAMSERLSAPAPVAEIARLQVVSAAPHAYQPDDARVRLPLTLRGIRSGTVFLSPETLRSCIARKSRRTIKPPGARHELRAGASNVRPSISRNVRPCLVTDTG